MKELLVIAMMTLTMLAGCLTPPTPKSGKKETAKQQEAGNDGANQNAASFNADNINDSVLQAEENGLYPVQVVFIGDRSLSFVNKFEKPEAALFKPIYDKITSYNDVVFDLRMGLIFNTSDIVLENCHWQPQELPVAPKVESKGEKKKSVWIDDKQGGEKKEINHYSPPPNTNWNEFARDVGNRLAQPPSRKSDIASAISRAQESFNEHRLGKKFLILATDFEDSYNNAIPQVTDPSIVVYCIGISKQVDVESILNTRVRRMESLAAALRDISKQL